MPTAEIHAFNPAEYPTGLILAGIDGKTHPGTKKVGFSLINILKDKRVRVYMGVELGKNLFPADLTEFSKVINCTGAPIPIQLGVEGEKTADLFYYQANGIFHPTSKKLHTLEELLGFGHNCELVVYGSGNVSKDIANRLVEHQYIIKNFARCSVEKTKISLNELQGLVREGIAITAEFDQSLVCFDHLDPKETAKQRAIYEFFLPFKNKKIPLGTPKQIHFIFNHVLEKTKKQGDDTLCLFKNGKQIVCKALITALGQKADPALQQLPNSINCGWANPKAKAGTLPFAAAQGTDVAILVHESSLRGELTLYRSKLENHRIQQIPHYDNQDCLNTVEYYQDGHSLPSHAALAQARRYNKSPTLFATKPAEKPAPTPAVTVNDPSKVHFNLQGQLFSRTARPGQTALEGLLEFGAAVGCSCGAGKTCGDCVLETEDPKIAALSSTRGKAVIEALSLDPKRHVLACDVEMSKLAGSILIVKNVLQPTAARAP